MIYDPRTFEERWKILYAARLSRRAERAAQRKINMNRVRPRAKSRARAPAFALLSLLSAVNSLRSDEWKLRICAGRLTSARYSTKRE